MSTHSFLFSFSKIVNNTIWKYWAEKNRSKGKINNTMATPQCKPKNKIPELNSKFPFQHIYSCSVLSGCLIPTGTIWLGPLTVTCMCIIYRGHTLQQQQQQQYIIGGEGHSRAQNESTLWVQTLVLHAALQNFIIIILSVQTIWGQRKYKEEGRKKNARVRNWTGHTRAIRHVHATECFIFP